MSATDELRALLKERGVEYDTRNGKAVKNTYWNDGHDRQVERAAQIAQVIAEHPGLPIKVLAPCTPSDYDTYWHEATGARVAWLLYPDEVQGWDLEHYCGLNGERVYSDEGDAAEDVADCLFDQWWDHAQDHGMRYERLGETPDDVLTRFCGYEYDYGRDVSIDRMCELVSRAMVDDMPWHECVVIDCY